MCGIIGAFGPSAASVYHKRDILLKELNHRGPDGNGIWISEDNNCVLGHTRLAILDLSTTASQPMQDEKGVLIYNGEIYNHLELRKIYEKEHASPFKTHSDTETLLKLLHMHNKTKIIKSLDGMYAGAFYNKIDGSLFLFRDPAGIKPLYFKKLKDDTFIFSSEIKPILLFSGMSDSHCDYSVLNAYLTFENWPQGHSLFGGIQQILPGETLQLSATTVNKIKEDRKSIKAYQKNNFKNKMFSNDYESLVKYVRESVESSVKSHLLSDVPLAAYLSGGLDSGAIVSIAARYSKDLLTFTGYYDIKDGWYDERPYAKETALASKVDQIEVPITANDFLLNFDKFIKTVEEPRMGMGAFSQMVVAEKVSEYRKVILTGHGGDELFFGYPLCKAALVLSKFPKLDSLKILASLSSREWPWLLNMLAEKVSGNVILAPRLGNISLLKSLNNDEINQFQKEFFSKNIRTTLFELEKYYINLYLPGLLAVEDKISMAFGLETRTPFCSPHFIKKISDIPLEMRMSNNRLKGLFKDAISCWLPENVIHAPKRGFPTPFRHWFKRELKSEVERRLIQDGDCLDPLISKDTRKQLLWSQAHVKLPFALDEKRAHKIWMLLCLESWGRQFNINWTS